MLRNPPLLTNIREGVPPLVHSGQARHSHHQQAQPRWNCRKIIPCRWTAGISLGGFPAEGDDAGRNPSGADKKKFAMKRSERMVHSCGSR